MVTKEQNIRLTQTGPGTSGGRLLRSYWQPAALVEELDESRPLIAVTLMGEQLVLFRDELGRYGLMDRHCTHRGADLCFGRLEDGGLRCTFHGWLFDSDGQCIEQGAEPIGSKFHLNVAQKAYPCVERNGIVFAYLGEGDPLPVPSLDAFAAPDSHTFAFKGLLECNWMQTMEVGIDPSHASFLHRFFTDEDTDEQYGKQFRDKAADSDIPITQLLREYPRPQIKTEKTDFGLRLITLREINEQQLHVRVTNCIFPNAITIPMSRDMVITQWHVPVDDTTTYWYAVFTSFTDAVDRRTMREQRVAQIELPSYRSKLNKSNNYGFDPVQQATEVYTGMGYDINVHDQWAVESLGPIADRTKEHLSKLDIGIVQFRRMFEAGMTALDHGDTPPFRHSEEHSATIIGPPATDAFGRPDSWADDWILWEQQRREQAPWSLADRRSGTSGTNA